MTLNTAEPFPIPLGFHVDRADAMHVQAAQDAGGSFVVYVMNWANIEPTPGYLYWEASDAALRAAEFYGVGVVARLDRPPDWALDPASPTPWSLDAYATFVHRVVERYGDRLDGIILWNEPNLQLEWQGQTPDPTAYVALLRAGAGAARAVEPTLPIFMAGLAFTEGGDGNLNDLTFLEEVYAAGGAVYFDGLALHPYGFGAPPTTAPSPDRLNFRRLELHRQIMIENGDAAKPAWITEMGWRVRAPDPADAWQVVTPAQQAAYLQQAIELVATNYPWIERMAFWQLVAAGDRYGFDFWQGPDDTSPAYAALVVACQRNAGCGKQTLTPTPKPETATTTVEILAPDVTIRLGDRGTLHPHWVHLHDNGNADQASTLQWQGEFFVQPGQQLRDYSLLLETMQIDQPLNQLTINGTMLSYLTPRSRPDPTSTWVTQRISVPVGLLRAGVNTVRIVAGSRNPAWQYDYWRWENFQVRNLRLQSTASDGPAAQTAPLFTDWRRIDQVTTRLGGAKLKGNGLGGWTDVIRLRPGNDNSVWITGNRLGAIWHAVRTDNDVTSDVTNSVTNPVTENRWQLSNQAGSVTQRRFNDVVEWNGYTVAATSEGLLYRRADNRNRAWHRVRGAPPAHAVVVLMHNSALYAGFIEQGLWRATAPAGPWQQVDATPESVLDLAEGGSGHLYVATPTRVYRPATVQPQAVLATPTWQPLPALPAAAETQFVTRLYSGTNGDVVARINDQLWHWDGAAWAAYGPIAAEGRALVSAVAACCDVGTVVHGPEVGLQVYQAEGQWEQHPAAGDFANALEVADLLLVDDTLVVGSTNGVFTWSPDQSEAVTDGWQTMHGLPTTVSDLHIAPSNPEQWVAATPAGLFRSTDAGTQWRAVTPPWSINALAWVDDKRLYLARNRGVAWSADVTATSPKWIESAGYDRVHFFQIAPHPTIPEQIWAGTWGNDIGISTNAGRTMKGLGNGLETLSVLAIWWHATPGQISIATIAGLYRSDDGGTSWFRLPGPVSQQTVYALYQTDDGSLWAGAADGLWRSKDYGASWERAPTLPTMTVLRMGLITAPDGQSHLWVGTESDGWWISDDGGNSWHFAGLAGHSVFAVVTPEQTEDSATEARIVVTTDCGMFETDW